MPSRTPRSVSRALAPSLMLGLALLACRSEPPPAGSDPGAAAGSTAVSSPEPWFAEVTDEVGIDFRHETGASGELLFPEMAGSGVGIFDGDGDGDLDVLLINSALELEPGPDGPVDRYFENVGGGRFVDATEASGLGDPGYGMGVAVGDVDNDGDEDVYVTSFGPDRLYVNAGDGTFVDRTEAAGIAVGHWSTSAVFCDVDLDGFLDLYVVRYVRFDRTRHCTDKAGRRDYCGPASYEVETDVLLRNRGDGTFRDATREAGIDRVTGAGLGVVCEDLDEDGRADFYVANDGDPNQLWINRGDGTFTDEALIRGASVNSQGLEEAGMGVLASDFDNDGDLDLFLTHLREETNTFYRNLGPAVGFQDETEKVGLGLGSAPFTGFGTAALDADLDGDLDLVVANGRVKRGDPLTDDLPEPWNLYAEPNLFYRNDDGEFRLLGEEAAALTAPVEVSRGLAAGDLDGDGDLDLVLVNAQGRARVVSGTPPGSGHWLLVDAVDPGVGRRAVGAQITVATSAGSQLRTISSGMSYLSASDPRAHFGLGPAAEVEEIRVRWPGGATEVFPGGAADRLVVLQRGSGRPAAPGDP